MPGTKQIGSPEDIEDDMPAGWYEKGGLAEKVIDVGATPRLYPADSFRNGRLWKPLAPPPRRRMSESQRPWRRSLALRNLAAWPWFKYGNDEFR